MYERNRISLTHIMRAPTCYVNWTLPAKATGGATNLEVKIRNGDVRMEIPTTHKNFIQRQGPANGVLTNSVF